ncbi:penicillin-binding transpeptidase domain-containing protein [Niabella hirudinis]|uniref:penicillin-binding transpeptidase domain-containing protein n=1 Tax=Niabella hirudinis TaxID=1285929 RepID=UPI003EC0AAC6
MNTYRLTVDNPKYGNVKRGYEKWEEYMHKLGLGVRLGVDLPSEDRGKIPTVGDYDEDYKGNWSSCTNLTLGMGQDKMIVTPLQLANATCIIANRGYYYSPHFVDSIERETPADAPLLKKYRQRQEVLTHISAAAYDAIINGMNDVVTQGTAKVAAIPGIDVCAKTGTAQNATVLDGRRIQLEDNSMFICFAPKDHPKIAIAVVVENAGYGATWAGPIARMLMEQYLLDSLTNRSKADLEQVSRANLVPWYFERLQYKTDSIRAEQWTRLTGDSTRLHRFLKHTAHSIVKTPGGARDAIKPVRDTATGNATQPGKKYTSAEPEWAGKDLAGAERKYFWTSYPGR